MKHTTGPWNYCDGDADYEAFSIYSDQGHIGWVSTTYDGDTDGTSISEQDKADARLIVAAPDLFACLQNLVTRKLIVGMESATGPSNDHIDEAIAAIDKALGKE